MSSKAVTYRHDVQQTDGATVRAIVESSGFFSPAEVSIALELVEERLAKGIASGYHFLFAGQAGETIGYACYGPIPGTAASYDLYWIAVRNDRRGGGIGSALLARCEDAIARLGGRRIYVETSSREQYETTRRFYQGSGYSKEALLPDFYAPGDAKVVYVKEISAPPNDCPRDICTAT